MADSELLEQDHRQSSAAGGPCRGRAGQPGPDNGHVDIALSVDWHGGAHIPNNRQRDDGANRTLWMGRAGCFEC